MKRTETKIFTLSGTLPAVLFLGMALSACSDAREGNVSLDNQTNDASTPKVVHVKTKDDIGPLFAAIGDKRFVLLGESTHGTYEYYHWRKLISQRLIRDDGFRFVAVEGDWESIARLNRYVKHRKPEDIDAATLLRDMNRWPQWMWGNDTFATFVEWLKAHNEPLPENRRVGVYGLDMQGPSESMKAVKRWFDQHDPTFAEQVRERYRPVSGDDHGFRRYAQSLARGGARLKDDFEEVVERLRGHLHASPHDDRLFSAKMNALAVSSAEAQHHAMLARGPESWNVRASFMHTAFVMLAERYGHDSRGIVWAHNTHVGDAGATDMARRGETNIGQLLRQAYGPDRVFILGFATYHGTVLAGRDWGAPMELMSIVPARKDSLEAMLHERGFTKTMLLFDNFQAGSEWHDSVPHRAIGVVYRPPHEAYVPSIPAQRYNALFYIHETRALTPL